MEVSEGLQVGLELGVRVSDYKVGRRRDSVPPDHAPIARIWRVLPASSGWTRRGPAARPQPTEWFRAASEAPHGPWAAPPEAGSPRLLEAEVPEIEGGSMGRESAEDTDAVSAGASTAASHEELARRLATVLHATKRRCSPA